MFQEKEGMWSYVRLFLLHQFCFYYTIAAESSCCAK